MSYPLVVLGAGASFDYIDPNHNTGELNWVPPLTDDLLNFKRFKDTISKFPHVGDLFADAIRKVPSRMTLEEYLTEIKNGKASTDRNRQIQLNALGFYLQELFTIISDRYGHQRVNNYNALIGLIKDNGGEACIVNFNYDNLLEENIESIDNTIASYIAGSIKVIKLHGGCDWVSYHYSLFPIEMDSYHFLISEPWYFTLPGITQPKLMNQRRLLGDPYRYHNGERDALLFPAVAIPVANKEVYICPEDHLQNLHVALAKTDRILIIGWSAGDPNLIQILEQNIKKQTKVLIVTRSEESGSDIVKKLEHIKFFKFKISKTGSFTNFLKSDEADSFFANKEVKING
ncbi:MAG: hypothetical protein Q7T54_00435 [Candidatus Levybacteria bacterium]|nr:hypothetical protein [Candidatus Levybacteria bacterium]